MANRLQSAQSLYLRKHAENPIDWWSWGEEALATAAAQDKPIFLSIGYSSCHWCTVMEGEAFSNLEIADYLNKFFLPIKVDREERPDLDSIYMQALQMMAGQGGWPLNIFLTPGDLVPFYGGTYFPVNPRFNRPGFLDVLQSIRCFYDLEKEKLQTFKQDMMETLQRTTVMPHAKQAPSDSSLLQTGITANASVLEPQAGMARPQFPMIPYANLALQGSRFEKADSARRQSLAIQRGKNLVLGGVFDQVGGGFHRYTVDTTWTVPHFEKMLYDNGQILEYLANLWSDGWQDPCCFRAIEQSIGWLTREMRDPSGFFWAAQDADSFVDADVSEPEEGAFYVWSYAQLQTLLTPEQFEACSEAFEAIDSRGNFEEQIVLQRRQLGVLPDLVESALTRLFVERYGTPREQLTTFPPAPDALAAKATHWPRRIPPVTDTKMIVAWNSLVISGLARASAVFQRPDWLHLASDAAKFILNHQYLDKRLQRINYGGQETVASQSEDYALLIKALLDLFSAEPDNSDWLDLALQIQSEFDERLGLPDNTGYYNNEPDASPDLIIQERSYADNATPSANGIAIANLVRLGLLCDRSDYLEKAQISLKSFSSVMENSATACPSLFAALDWLQYGRRVTVREDLIPQLQSRYLPTTVWQISEDLPDLAIAIVCQGESCLAPAETSTEMFNQLAPQLTYE
ncbi:MAG: thioredoxin domain-containing protein [Cyanobacteria bacterium P01_H01_bin.15]